jgi:serine/threonine-protein kinase
MSNSLGHDSADAAQTLTRRADQQCDRFEAAWKAGQQPRTEDYLAGAPEADPPALLRELLLLEVAYRCQAGEQLRADEFLQRFPGLERDWIVGALAGSVPPTGSIAPTGPQPPPGLSEIVDAPVARSVQRLQLPSRAGGGADLAGDVTLLLHKRLRFISLVVLALCVYATIALALGLARDFESTIQVWIYTPPFFLAFFTVALMAIVLWRQRTLSLRKLRVIELTLFGLMLIGPSWDLFCDLFFLPQFPWAAGWARSLEEDIYFLNLHSSDVSLAFFILIVSYATLIPSNWRRCTLVVGIMAATPLTISAVACVTTMATPTTFFLAYIVKLIIILAIAVAIAAYGTHRIERLRREVAEARKLGQYRLMQRLGSGGMGEVYLAEHVLLKQPCAIKLIRAEHAGDPATLRRFEREVHATSRLKHWNTVQIYDYGHAADGTFYYVMEYLPGLTLEQLVKRHGPLSPGRAVHLLRQACAALREAHSLGLVHRDIKPANIMLCERGGVHDVVKLLDFGLVKAVGLDGRDESLTQEGVITGTPAYMSPEQASGQDGLDGRTDIYSLGAVAYFLLTGQPPFPRDRAIQAIVAHIHEPVQPMTELRAEVPTDLQDVVLRCLEKAPSRRFADVCGLHDALAGCDCAGQSSEDQATPESRMDH